MSLNTCMNDILNIINQQASSSILFISDKSKDSEVFFNFLSQNYCGTLSFYNDEDIDQSYDMIIISDLFLFKSNDFVDTLSALLQYVNHSLLLFSCTYVSSEDKPTSMFGTRYLYPTHFSCFDFSYHNYSENIPYQAYNFYPTHHTTIDIDTYLSENYPVKYDAESRLNILYPLPHNKLTGGLKCLLAHVRQLYKRGHNVYILTLGENNEFPSWSDLVEGDDFTKVLHSRTIEDIKKISKEYNIDVCMLGFYSQIPLFQNTEIPLVYWEQGSETAFGDYLLRSYNDPNLADLRERYNFPIAIVTNSFIMSEILNARYGRITPLLYTGIDTSFYYPVQKQMSTSDIPKILIVGNPFLKFKGFQLLLNILIYIYSKGYNFTVTWACQNEVNINVSFPLNIKLNITQDELAQLYRSHDIFISSSVYEAFSMPPLEALASGIAVIATDNGGIHSYAKPGENMLLVDQGKPNDLASSIIYLLTNPEARRILGKNGRKTALEYEINNLPMQQLEDILHTVISYYK